MVRKLIAATALALVSAAPASAALFTVTFSNVGPDIVNIDGAGAPPNDFADLLGTHFGLLSSLTRISSITLSDPSSVTVDFLASESALTNTFTIGSYSFSETDSEFIPAGQYKTTLSFLAPTDLTGLMSFSGGSSNGTVNPGGDGFAVFLPIFSAADLLSNPLGFALNTTTNTWTYTTDTLFIGYDDWDGDNTSDDDNHDDMIVRLTASVPESSTWAMLIAGFMTVGAAMRRRGGRKLVQAV